MPKNRILVSLLAALFLAGCEPDVKIVSVDPSTLSITSPTETKQIEAVPADLRGNKIDGVPVTYRSTNTAVATVDQDGNISPIASGTASIIASTASGKQGEAMVKVCLPKEIICDPPQVLELRVGTAAPLKCHLTDCNDETLTTTVEFEVVDTEAILKEGSDTFIGKKVGDTEIVVSGDGLKKTIAVKIGEQLFAPGMEPGSRTGGGGGGGGRAPDRNKDPYDEKGGGGQFGHILKNM